MRCYCTGAVFYKTCDDPLSRLVSIVLIVPVGWYMSVYCLLYDVLLFRWLLRCIPMPWTGLPESSLSPAFRSLRWARGWNIFTRQHWNLASVVFKRRRTVKDFHWDHVANHVTNNAVASFASRSLGRRRFRVFRPLCPANKKGHGDISLGLENKLIWNFVRLSWWFQQS